MFDEREGVRKAARITFLAVFAVAAAVTSLHAISAPSSGSFAYDIYDIAVNKMLNGPVGFVTGVGAIVYGAITAMRAHLSGVIPILAGAAILKAKTIVSSMGLLIR